MEKRVSINRLPSPFITRGRAKEAYHGLRDHIAAGPIELDLNTADLISLSFLDEIILRLKEADQLDKVIFLATNQHVQDKLKQIASVRNVSFLLRAHVGMAAKPIEPKTPETLIVKNLRTGT